MSKKVTILLPLLQDIGLVHVKSDVLLLCSGSADCVLWKSAERPLRCHTACVTGPQSSGECVHAAFIRSLLCGFRLTSFAGKRLSLSVHFHIWCRQITLASFPPLSPRQNVQRCLLVRPWPCCELCSRMFTFRWVQDFWVLRKTWWQKEVFLYIESLNDWRFWLFCFA